MHCKKLRELLKPYGAYIARKEDIKTNPILLTYEVKMLYNENSYCISGSLETGIATIYSKDTYVSLSDSNLYQIADVIKQYFYCCML